MAKKKETLEQYLLNHKDEIAQRIKDSSLYKEFKKFLPKKEESK